MFEINESESDCFVVIGEIMENCEFCFCIRTDGIKGERVDEVDNVVWQPEFVSVLSVGW